MIFESLHFWRFIGNYFDMEIAPEAQDAYFSKMRLHVSLSAGGCKFLGNAIRFLTSERQLW